MFAAEQSCVSCEERQHDQLNAEQYVFDLIYKAILQQQKHHLLH
jgi:hypothetical protein